MLGKHKYKNNDNFFVSFPDIIFKTNTLDIEVKKAPHIRFLLFFFNFQDFFTVIYRF